MENTENVSGCAIIPRPLDEAEAILRAHAETQEFWLALVDVGGWALFEQAIRRHYCEASPDDYFACVTHYKGVMLATIVLRRRLMTADKYRFELSKQGISISARELVEGGALIRTDPENIPLAREFASEVLGFESGDAGLAMGA
jgi:hypothetical protein